MCGVLKCFFLVNLFSGNFSIIRMLMASRLFILLYMECCVSFVFSRYPISTCFFCRIIFLCVELVRSPRRIFRSPRIDSWYFYETVGREIELDYIKEGPVGLGERSEADILHFSEDRLELSKWGRGFSYCSIFPIIRLPDVGGPRYRSNRAALKYAGYLPKNQPPSRPYYRKTFVLYLPYQ